MYLKHTLGAAERAKVVRVVVEIGTRDALEHRRINRVGGGRPSSLRTRQDEVCVETHVPWVDWGRVGNGLFGDARTSILYYY